MTVNTAQLPIHTHGFQGSIANGTSSNVQNTVLAGSTGSQVYRQATPTLDTPMKPQAIGNAGGSQAHDNRQPYLVLSWIISLFGIYPSQ